MTNSEAATILRGIVQIDHLRLLAPERAAITQAAETLSALDRNNFIGSVTRQSVKHCAWENDFLVERLVVALRQLGVHITP